MENPTAGNRPFWRATANIPDLSRLGQDESADVCVVGAGIAGLSTAYELALRGRSVIVIDQGHIGGGMTGRTTAHFSNAFDDRYCEIEDLHGVEAAQIVAESHTRAIERACEIAREENIDCDLSRLDGWLFTPPGEAKAILERELDAARRAGVPGVALAARAPLDFDTGPALRFPDQMQLHPLKYLAGLVSAIAREKGRIYTQTRAVSIEGGAQATIRTERGQSIRARSVVVATNTPVNNVVVIHTKQAAYQTYVISAGIPRDSLTRALYWDTAEPYHYVRLQSAPTNDGMKEFLIVGGEDHKTGQDDDPAHRWVELEAWMRAYFPQAGPVEYRWSGEVMEPNDRLGFIGKDPLDHENVYIVTGDSGNGMTHGVIAGMLLADQIDGRINAWSKLYDPSRITLRAGGTFAKENANVAKQYTAWLRPGDVEDVSEIPRGQGSILREGMSLIAVHVDNEGQVHKLSAACPHLGCVVRWNGAERSWDCPCHGSRFSPLGKVLHGPAVSDLKAIPSDRVLGANDPVT